MTMIVRGSSRSWCAAVLASSLVMPGAALAQEAGETCPIASAEDVEPRRIDGEVVRTQIVPVEGTDDPTLLVWVSTDDGDQLAIDAGPIATLDEALVADQPITAEGRVYAVGDDRLLVATRIGADGQMVQIDREADERRHAARMRQERGERRAEARAEQRPARRQAQRAEAGMGEAEEPVDVYLTEDDEPADLDVAIVEDDPDLRVDLVEEDEPRAQAGGQERDDAEAS